MSRRIDLLTYIFGQVPLMKRSDKNIPFPDQIIELQVELQYFRLHGFNIDIC